MKRICREAKHVTTAGPPPRWSSIFTNTSKPRTPPPVTFHRRELDLILKVYGRMVGEGEWRDYAIDHLRDRAVFSVFKRAGEVPLYRIEKNPKLAAKQGAFSVLNAHGTILKRGHELAQVLKAFDKVLKLVKT